MSAQVQRLNQHLASAKPSATYKMADKVTEMRAAGKHVTSFVAGEPDLNTPPHVIQAAIEAMHAGKTRYSPVCGLRELREAVAAKFQRENGLPVTWSETIVCNGGKQVLYNALAATLNIGDEVIIPAPYWVSYPEMVQLTGASAIIVPCPEKDGFKLTPDALTRSITPRTRWLILNSPSNPTGAVYSRHELQALADILHAHPDILVLSDDIYEHLIYDDAQFYTMAQVDHRMRDRTLTMNGASKAYAMTGWRIGFGTGPRWLLEAMETLQSQQTSGACTISQYAALAALNGPQDFVREARAIYQRRRDIVVQRVNAIAGLRCSVPTGAFYAFIACDGLIGSVSRGGMQLRSDEDIALALLEDQGIATVHGSAFGLGPYLRLAYAADDEALAVACESIESFCRSLN